MKKSVWFLLAVAGICAFTACSRPRTELLVASQPNVNPDFTGRPSPVVLKVYELRRGLAFRQADFQTLFDRPIQALGSDILAADELVFVPGEARTVTYLHGPDAHFLGIVAGFRQMDRARWRSLRPIDADGKNLIGLELNDASILVIPTSKLKDWNPEESVKQQQQRTAEPELSEARVAPAPDPARPQTLTAYDGEAPAPVQPAPPSDPDEIEAARRMPSQDMTPTPGMAEPEEPRPAATRKSGKADAQPRRESPARPAGPYAVPPMRTVD